MLDYDFLKFKFVWFDFFIPSEIKETETIKLYCYILDYKNNDLDIVKIIIFINKIIKLFNNKYKNKYVIDWQGGKGSPICKKYNEFQTIMLLKVIDTKETIKVKFGLKIKNNQLYIGCDDSCLINQIVEIIENNKIDLK